MVEAIANSKQRYRSHFMKIKVRVQEYSDKTLAVFHGPRCLGRYTATGQMVGKEIKTAV